MTKTQTLPKELARYRTVSNVRNPFRFAIMCTDKPEADKDARRLRRKGFRVRVMSVNVRYQGVVYNYALYVRRGRIRGVA